jgi:hypothetical protein
MKHIRAFLGGFICAAILIWFLFLPKEDKAQFDEGFRNGELQGQMDVIDAIQKEFGLYDGHGPYKFLFEVHTTDLVSIETNGIKTVRIIP